MTDYLASLIRTVVPVAVGFVLTWLAARGIEIDDQAAIGFVTSVVIAVYYAAVRAAEARWPKLGWLLGLPKPPSYESGAQAA